ncbi:MAG: hypothetical protein A2145_00420 [candidate division Zixibacteria bacterium RBG_16_40_9]|nr:MAG: hypothetical protein A2145_00420 [candidate division Zixibacteria bacterium RBG_16_40_9]
MLKNLIISARPHQWLKNSIVLAALVFAKKLNEINLVLISLAAFGIFCLLSSGVYILNDIFDLKKDQKHPLKSKRPIASEKISVSQAAIFSIIILTAALLLAFKIDFYFGLSGLGYVVLNFFYTVFIKDRVILDVMAVALGFVLRAVAGAVAIQVEISSWLLVCTTLLALFLSLGKRRHELVLLEEEAKNHRKILTEYSPYFLDQMIAVVTASTVVAYSFYTLSPEVEQKFDTKLLSLTIPFVIYGIFRYLYLIHQKIEGGNPTKALLTDKPLLLNVFLWFGAVLLILYF